MQLGHPLTVILCAPAGNKQEEEVLRNHRPRRTSPIKMGGPARADGLNQGFTLIELTVILVIISLATLLVIPRFPSTEASRLRGSARSLVAVLRYLGDQAVSAKTPFRLNFDLNEGRILISRIDARGGETPAEDVFLKRRFLAEGVTIKDVELPRLGKVSSGQVSVDFNGAGLEEFLLIHLQGIDKAYLTIAAFPQNGKVKVLEGYQEAVL